MNNHNEDGYGYEEYAIIISGFLFALVVFTVFVLLWSGALKDKRTETAETSVITCESVELGSESYNPYLQTRFELPASLPISYAQKGDNETDDADETETESDDDGTENSYYNYNLTDYDIELMATITYYENGVEYPSCTYETVYLTACVILNRYLDWNYPSIESVIYDGGQYSTSSYADGYYDSISYQAVLDAVNDTDRNPHYQSQFGQGIVYYTDPYTGETFCY